LCAAEAGCGGSSDAADTNVKPGDANTSLPMLPVDARLSLPLPRCFAALAADAVGGGGVGLAGSLLLLLAAGAAGASGVLGAAALPPSAWP